MAQTLANALRIGFRVVSLISHSRSGWQSKSSSEVVDDFVSEGASSYNKSHSNQTAAAIHSIKTSCNALNSTNLTSPLPGPPANSVESHSNSIYSRTSISVSWSGPFGENGDCFAHSIASASDFTWMIQ